MAMKSKLMEVTIQYLIKNPLLLRRRWRHQMKNQNKTNEANEDIDMNESVYVSEALKVTPSTSSTNGTVESTGVRTDLSNNQQWEHLFRDPRQ